MQLFADALCIEKFVGGFLSPCTCCRLIKLGFATSFLFLICPQHFLYWLYVTCKHGFAMVFLMKMHFVKAAPMNHDQLIIHAKDLLMLSYLYSSDRVEQCYQKLKFFGLVAARVGHGVVAHLTSIEGSKGLEK